MERKFCSCISRMRAGMGLKRVRTLPVTGCCLWTQVTTLVNELGRTRLEVNVKVKAEFGKNLFALNVVVTIPVPETTAHADVQTKIGATPSPPANPPVLVHSTLCLLLWGDWRGPTRAGCAGHLCMLLRRLPCPA